MEQEDNDALPPLEISTQYITEDGRRILDFGNLLLTREPKAQELTQEIKRRWDRIARLMTHEQLISAYVSVQIDYAVTGALYSKTSAEATEAERRVRELEKEIAQLRGQNQ